MKKLWKRLVCILWHGEHEWKIISPEYQGQNLAECTRCGKRKVGFFWPSLILIFLLSLVCTSCTESIWTGKDTYVVTQIRTETDHRYTKLGKYEVTAQCFEVKKFISFNTDSIYSPGDTLKIGRK